MSTCEKTLTCKHGKTDIGLLLHESAKDMAVEFMHAQGLL